LLFLSIQFVGFGLRVRLKSYFLGDCCFFSRPASAMRESRSSHRCRISFRNAYQRSFAAMRSFLWSSVGAATLPINIRTHFANMKPGYARQFLPTQFGQGRGVIGRLVREDDFSSARKLARETCQEWVCVPPRDFLSLEQLEPGQNPRWSEKDCKSSDRYRSCLCQTLF
jgi:hypothetical protein